MTQWRSVQRTGSLGGPFECWEPIVQRIPDSLLKSVIYLVPPKADTEDEARKDEAREDELAASRRPCTQ